MESEELKRKLDEANQLIEKLKRQNNEIVTFDEQLFQIKENIRGLSGQELFIRLLMEIYNYTKLDYLFIAKLKEDKEHFRTIATVYKGRVVENFEYTVAETPCENVYGKDSLIFDENIQSIFPNDILLKEYNIDAYIGIPLFSSTDEPLGILVGLSETKLEESEKKSALMQFFEERISTEIERVYIKEKLDSTEQHFNSFLANIDAIVVFLDTNGNLTYCNDYFLKLTGYKLSEVLGKNWFDTFIPPDVREQVFNVFTSTIKSEDFPRQYEYEILLKNGEVRLIKWTNTVFYDENGHILRAASYGEDITEKKKIEQELKFSEERFKALADATTEGIIISENGIIIDVNNRITEITGFSKNDLIGKNLIDFISDEYKKEVYENVKNERENFYEVKILKKDNTSFPALVNARMINLLGKRVRISTINDISELRKTIEDLEISRKKYREISILKSAILESAKGIIVFTLDKEYRYLDFTRNHKETMKKIWGVDIEIGKSMLEYIKNDKDRDKAKKNFDRALNGESFVLQEEYGDEKLSRMYWENRYNPVYDENNEIIGLSVYVIDITENIKLRKQIEESERKYRTLLDLLPVGVAIHRNNKFLYANTTALRIIGFEEFDKRLIDDFEPLDFVHPDYHNKVLERMNKVSKGIDKPSFIEVQFLKRDKTPITVESMINVIDYEGEPALQVIFIDLTEKKIIEEKLSESEEKYKNLINNAPIGIAVHQNGEILFVNDTALKLIEYENQNELIGKNVLEFIHPDYRQIVLERIRTIKDKGEVPPIIQEVFITKNGKPLNVETNAIPIIYEGKNAIMVMFYDISYRIEAEKKIRESQIKYQTIFDNAPESIFLMNKDIFIECNSKTLEMFGCKREDIIGKPPYLFSPEYQYDGQDSKTKALYYINKAYEGESLTFEWLHKKLNGDLFDAIVSLNVIKLNDKTLLQAIVRDVSIERAQQQEIKKLAKIIETTPQLVVITDLEGNIEYVNNSYIKNSSYSEEEILGNKIYHFTTKECVDKIKKEVIPHLLKNNNWQGEIDIIRKDGGIINGNFVCSVIKDEKNHPVHFVAVITDITKIKEAERALKESEEKYRLLVNNQSDMVVKVDIDNKFIYVSPSYCKTFGKKEEELLGKSFVPLVHPDDIEHTLNEMKKLFKPPYNCRITQRAMTVDGWKWIEWIDTAIVDNDGQVKEIIGVGRDINDLVIAENALKESEENLRITLNSIGDAVIATDVKGSIVRMNPVAEKLSGWKFEEAQGKNLDDILVLKSSLDGRRIKSPIDEVIRTKSKVGLSNHTKLISKSGEEYQIADSAAPIVDFNGNIVGVVMVFRDVTEEYKIREKLRKNEDRLSKIMLAANDGMWDWNLITNEVYYDPRYYTMAGYEVNEFPGHLDEFSKRLHPDERERILKLNYDHIEGKTERYIAEFRFLTKSGQYMWILSRGYIVERDENGKPVRFVGTHTDITERKLMEEELRLSEQKFRSLFENMKLGLVIHKLIVDENNKPIDYIFLDMNDAYTELTSITRDAIGKKVTEVLPGIENDPADWIGKYGNIVLTGQSVTFEDYAQPLQKWFKVTAYKSGDMEFAVIVDDITKQKELEKQLQTVNEVLEERVKERTSQLEDAMNELTIENRKRKQIQEDLLRYQKELRKAIKKEKELNMMKSAFISMVSHQYRTPLTVIQTSADLIPKYFKSHNEDKLKYHINRINISISKMTEMLEKIMMIGKFDVAQDKLELTEFNINEVVYIETEKLKEYDKNQHPITFERSSDEINIYSNKFIIEQIINNLLSNAAKYSENGSEIKVVTKEGNNFVKLIVSDKGIGIDKEDLDNIFDDFYRGSNVENIYGTGLGLSIVKRFCDKINATIDVQSKIGEGTTFTIMIPKK